MTGAKTNLMGMPREDLERFFLDLGEKPFRARQVMKWVYHHRIDDFDAMTDLSRGLRDQLMRIAEVCPPKIVTKQESSDGTTKWMLRMDSDQGIETVFIPEPKRGTLCISSQVGCALDCTFCATGKQGFNRNLSPAEIIGQVWLACRELGHTPVKRAVTNVVFMGMGEPLANYRSVLPALKVLTDDLGFELSKRRVTLSTAGLVPQMQRLADDTDIALAVSLHAPNDQLRDQLVPINRRHPIAELLEVCWHYSRKHNGMPITFEYVMLDGVNDSKEHAMELVRLMRNRPAKVNLIPFNPFPGTQYKRSSQETIDAFRQVLMDRGVLTMTRRPRGDDIDAACGQLAGQVNNRVRVRLRWAPVATRV